MDMQGTARVHVQIMVDESRALALQLKGGDAPPIAAAPSVALQAETLAPPKGVKQEAAKLRPYTQQSPAALEEALRDLNASLEVNFLGPARMTKAPR